MVKLGMSEQPALPDVDSTKEKSEIRLLLGCNLLILEEGIKHLLSTFPDVVVTGQAGTLHELTEWAKEMAFDTILIETSVLGVQAMKGLQKAKEALPTKPALVVHSVGDDHDLAVCILRQGAAGYVSRSSSTNELISAIYKVAGGRKLISNRISEKLAFEVDLYAPTPSITNYPIVNAK